MASTSAGLHDVNVVVNMAFNPLESYVMPSKFGGLSLRHVLALQQPHFLHPSPSTSQQVISIFIWPLEELLDPANESYRLDAASVFDLLFSSPCNVCTRGGIASERRLRHMCQMPTNGPSKRQITDHKYASRPRYIQIRLA